MLIHRLRRWINIKLTVSGRLVYLAGGAQQTHTSTQRLFLRSHQRWPSINLTQDQSIFFCSVVRLGGNMSPAHSNVVTAICTHGPTLNQHFLMLAHRPQRCPCILSLP